MVNDASSTWASEISFYNGRFWSVFGNMTKYPTGGLWGKIIIIYEPQYDYLKKPHEEDTMTDIIGLNIIKLPLESFPIHKVACQPGIFNSNTIPPVIRHIVIILVT